MNASTFTPKYTMTKAGPYNKSRRTIDTHKTEAALEALLRAKKVKMFANIMNDGTVYKSYPLRVVADGATSWSRSATMKYRVYFGQRWGGPRESFIQSNEKGELDIKKIVERLGERFAEDSKRERTDHNINNIREAKEAKAKRLDKKLNGTSFQLETARFSGFDITINVSADEVDALIAKLQKHFKN